MAKKPTLLEPGRIRLADGTVPSETPLAYIQRWYKTRMPEFGGRDASIASRVLVVKAETGSGKSTVMPVGLFRLLRDERTPTALRFRKAGVICTQPRVLTAISLARDVSSERNIGGVRTRLNADMVLGETVGFQTGPVSNMPPGGLVYATAGVLAAQLRRSDDARIMARYRFIIVDEAHERSLDADMLLYLLRGFYRRNAGNEALPFLALASATFAPERYAEYFGVGAGNIVRVEGRSYEIDTAWLDLGTNNYPRAAIEAVRAIHEAGAGDAPERADILVFVPGAAESALVSNGLSQLNRRWAAGPSPGPLLVLAINSEVVASQSAAYPLVFERPDRLPLVDGRPPARRVIVSTIVAETGLTIDTLKYVVDAGWNRAREVYAPWGLEGIVTRPAALNRVEQRRGRAGRLFPGKFHPLYTQNVAKALDPQQLPDIVLTGVSEIYPALVGEQERESAPRAFSFRADLIGMLDPPPPEAVLAANAAATLLGFVTAKPPFQLTATGRIAARFSRASMAGVRLLLAGLVWAAAASDLLTIAASLGQPPQSLLTGAARRRGEVGGMPAGAKALRAALPSYFVSRYGGGDVLPPLESEMYYFRARYAIADDFAERALVFDAFMRRLDHAEGNPAAVSAWCAEHDLEYDALLDLARRRDLIADEMVAAGLNPYRGDTQRLSRLPVAEFADGLRRIKKCLYDGLRTHLLRWNPARSSYVTPQGAAVRTPDFLSSGAASRLRALRVAAGPDWRPRALITDIWRLKPVAAREDEAAAALLYAAEAGFVSVLDGFVDVDVEFITPRSFEPAAGSAPAATDSEATAAAPATATASSEATAATGSASAAAMKRLEAYGLVVRAAAEVTAGGPVLPPAGYLTGEQIETIFGLQQLALIPANRQL